MQITFSEKSQDVLKTLFNLSDALGFPPDSDDVTSLKFLHSSQTASAQINTPANKESVSERLKEFMRVSLSTTASWRDSRIPRVEQFIFNNVFFSDKLDAEKQAIVTTRFRQLCRQDPTLTKRVMALPLFIGFAYGRRKRGFAEIPYDFQMNDLKMYIEDHAEKVQEEWHELVQQRMQKMPG